MRGGSRRHAELAKELNERLEDLWLRRATSRVVLAAVPPGWGRTTVLDQLTAAASADEAPVTLVSRVSGRELPDGPGTQAVVLRGCLAEMTERHRAAELLGLDRFGGITQVGLGVGGLFVSGLAATAGFLVAGMALGAAGKAWDDSPAGQDGALARSARAVAATSVEVPVLVVIDDADCLDERVARTLIENLAARHDGHVLLVAAVEPGGNLQRALVSRSRQGLTEGRVLVADADADMGYAARADLVRELCPHLSGAVARRIAAATVTFADVFAVVSAPSLAEASGGDSEADLLALVNTVAAVRLQRPAPSSEAVVAVWAGGLLHSRQAGRALDVLGQPRAADSDPDLLRLEGLERVSNPAAARLAGEVAALSNREKAAMAALLAEEALRVAADPGCGLVERMAAAQAAHRVRRDLSTREALPAVQRQLVADLEELCETDAALDVAVDALRDYDVGASPADRDWLEAAVLRLAYHTSNATIPPAVAALIAEAAAHGTALGLEARVWAAAELLRDSSQRETALALTGQVTAALDAHTAALGTAADQWRLLLAFEAGRTGHPALTERLLAPLMTSGVEQREDAARAVLYACAGPGADIRLQNILLEAELAVRPSTADEDRLRIHHALSMNHHTLGEYGQALTHGQHELAVRITTQPPDHPDILAVRANIAGWTGVCGDAVGALRLYQELLPDQERVLGPHHPDTLSIRANIAGWTGECGDVADALQLARELLPDRQRVLGPHDPDTLKTRTYIASWTGRCGDAAVALRLYKELLPDQQRVLGPHHPDTLNTRSNIAAWTGESGDAAGALRLYKELLPDQQRVLGPHHPDTLKTRSNIARWTGEGGDVAGALRLYKELLPDRQRVLGPHHPDTLKTRNNIAAWTGESGDAAGALRLNKELLRDAQRVLGRDHPETLAIRNNIASLTVNRGDVAGALRSGITSPP